MYRFLCHCYKIYFYDIHEISPFVKSWRLLYQGSAIKMLIMLLWNYGIILWIQSRREPWTNIGGISLFLSFIFLSYETGLKCLYSTCGICARLGGMNLILQANYTDRCRAQKGILFLTTFFSVPISKWYLISIFKFRVHYNRLPVTGLAWILVNGLMLNENARSANNKYLQ